VSEAVRRSCWTQELLESIAESSQLTGTNTSSCFLVLSARAWMISVQDVRVRVGWR
jgi:hypothetical protein